MLQGDSARQSEKSLEESKVEDTATEELTQDEFFEMQSETTQTAVPQEPAAVPEPIKFDTYDKNRIPSVQTSQIKIICESITLCLSDDTGVETDRLLFLAKLQNMQLSMKSNDVKDDAGTFILKKMGVWQKLHSKEAREGLFKDIEIFADINMSYYNHHSLSYEPLLEPWYLQVSVTQLSRCTQQEIAVSSKKMLNLNMTFGMALTIKRIKDRILDSLHQAEILAKLERSEAITPEEERENRQWSRHLLTPKRTQTLKESLPVEERDIGFIFQNYTGQDLALSVHDEGGSELYYDITEQAKRLKGGAPDNQFNLPGNDPSKTCFVSLNTLKHQRMNIIKKKSGLYHV